MIRDTTHAPLRVSLPAFEGPLDLLLYLVKNAEVDIYDIPLAQITQQYLDILKQMEELDLEIAGEFLVMAAHLLYIKSRTLLPVSEQLPEEDAEEDDPRWDLIRQLIEYRKFKDAAVDLQTREEVQLEIFHRTDIPVLVSEDKLDLGQVTTLSLVHALQRVLDRLAQRKNKSSEHEITEELFTVEEKMEHIFQKLEQTRSLSFSELFSELASRREIVVTFLALLELIRLKHIRIHQPEPFVEITIESTL